MMAATHFNLADCPVGVAAVAGGCGDVGVELDSFVLILAMLVARVEMALTVWLLLLVECELVLDNGGAEEDEEAAAETEDDVDDDADDADEDDEGDEFEDDELASVAMVLVIVASCCG